MMFPILRLWVAGLFLAIELFSVLPLLLVVGILALIVCSHYLRNKKTKGEQQEDRRSLTEDASGE
jgi:hypothetical protein